MCGIAGYYSVSVPPTHEVIKGMAGQLIHRGPDAEGFYFDNYTGLAHLRLSILDLSANGNQPMFSHNKRFVMVYNGEVYNYREIANELKTVQINSNLLFNSSSDSEVILEAFSYWGPDFVHKLNGMFSIAIYDIEQNELFLFRDRIGIKPFYYFWNGKHFYFGSELKAFSSVSDIPKTINKRAVKLFLHLGYIPAPETIYSEVKKLESGSFIKLSKSGFIQEKYWSLNSQLLPSTLSNEKQALVKLSDLISSSVQYQLKSDVPFGVFLSGGIDSSLITAQASHLSSVKVNTFSIGFKENKYNESDYAKNIAKYLGTNHHEFIVSHHEAIDHIDAIFEAYSEPFADSSSIPTMLVSKLAKQYVTVTLSGEGGDELFFGYGAYIWANRLNNPLIKLLKGPIAKVLHYLGNRYKRAAELFEKIPESLINSHIFSQEQYLFSLKEVEKLVTPAYQNVPGFLHFDLPHLRRKLTPMERQSLFDLQFYLQDDLLTKVDRASMFYSLETRVPFLDHRIIEFAINLSPDLKYKSGVTKYLLKEILYQYIPKSYFDRPKQGFAIPLQKWLKHELRYLVEENLSKETIEIYGIVSFNEVSSLTERYYKGEDYLYNRIWLLIVLHKWLKKNNINLSLN